VASRPVEDDGQLSFDEWRLSQVLTEALGEASLLSTLDGLAETLDGREDLSAEVNLEVCKERDKVSFRRASYNVSKITHQS